MPMTAFLLQDIPEEVAEHASRVARSTRREMNDVLLEMLARAATQAAPVPTPARAPVPTAPVSTHSPAPTPAPIPAPAADASDEDLALFEAMQAAQSIPGG